MLHRFLFLTFLRNNLSGETPLVAAMQSPTPQSPRPQSPRPPRRGNSCVCVHAYVCVFVANTTVAMVICVQWHSVTLTALKIQNWSSGWKTARWMEEWFRRYLHPPLPQDPREHDVLFMKHLSLFCQFVAEQLSLNDVLEYLTKEDLAELGLRFVNYSLSL